MKALGIVVFLSVRFLDIHCSVVGPTVGAAVAAVSEADDLD